LRRQQEQSAHATRTTTIVAAKQDLHIGPLPKPETLAHFDQVVPGLAERIVKMAENNQADRLRTNRTARWVAMLGQIFAFTLAITAVVGALYLAAHDKDAAAVAAALGGLGIPLVAFLRRQ
jgi:uncharacterized membrane protein